MKRLGYALVWTLFGASCLVAACSDDSDDNTPTQADGGSEGAGAPATAGTAHGGSAAGGSAGATHGGAGSGGVLSDGGASGSPSDGGSDSPSAGGESTAGAGGAGELNYACNTTTQAHRVCSALVAANCPDPTDCADCVTSRTNDRELFVTCPACLAEYDAFEQCGIDAYESGNLSSGIECYEDFGADLNDSCGAHLQQALACSDYQLSNDCPATWPLPE
jgi:hypothetical protein